jgi:RHS repeat-associated protein
MILIQRVLNSLPLLIFYLLILHTNVPLHEWNSQHEETNESSDRRQLSGVEVDESGNLTTWIFEDGTFIPPDSYREAKLQGFKSYSIITDHLGTPVESYDEEGKKVWSRELNIYGETRKEFGEENFIPFLYQGQYLDGETELAYNRFRYYSPESGTYVSQDPIRLRGRMPNMYSYVKNVNSLIDPYGLMELFRSMSREEYFDIQQNGWDGKNNMESKWFAESYDDAVEWGHQMGHGSDSKFYVVGFEVDDDIAAKAFIAGDNHDGIGKARAIDVDDLNAKPTPVTSLNSQRVKGCA